MKPIILFLTTYRLSNPTGGGQLRSHALLRAYRETGFKTLSIAIYLAEGGPPCKEYPFDVPFPDIPEFRTIDGRFDIHLSDMMAGKWAASAGFSDVCERITEPIAAIHSEQVYLTSLAIKLRDRHPNCTNAILINGTENIEWIMKGEILTKKALPSSFVEHAKAEIRQSEITAAKNCDVSLAVTDTDLEWLRSVGASVVFLARNGVQPYMVNQRKMLWWRNRLPKFPWCFYAASAHPPNCSGFLDMLGVYYGYVPPNRRIVVVGGVCTLLCNAYDSSIGAGLRRSRLELLGEVDHEDLNAIKSLASLYVLPITEGGGSNLKTAEALYSGKRVITTTKGMRGYEKYMNLPSVYLADSSDEFTHTLSSELMNPAPSPNLSDANVELLSQLTWELCLKDAVTYIYALIQGS